MARQGEYVPRELSATLEFLREQDDVIVKPFLILCQRGSWVMLRVQEGQLVSPG